MDLHQKFWGFKTASTRYTKLTTYSKSKLYNETEAYSVTYQTSKLDFFCQNSEQTSAINYFRKKLHLRFLTWFPFQILSPLKTSNECKKIFPNLLKNGISLPYLQLKIFRYHNCCIDRLYTHVILNFSITSFSTGKLNIEGRRLGMKTRVYLIFSNVNGPWCGVSLFGASEFTRFL